MTFDAAAAKTLMQAIQSHAQKLGVFKGGINLHAPLTNVSPDLACWIILDDLTPTPESGLPVVSIIVNMLVLITMSLNTRPLDDVDPAVLGAATVLLNEYANNFTLGGLVRDVEVFRGLKAVAGYSLITGEPYRHVEITLPMIVNDAWTEAP